MLAFAPLFFAAVLAFGAAHGGPGHSCMHDTIVEGARQSWRTAGEPDRFVIQEHDLTQPGSHNSQTSRSLLSYSNIRIKIMTDLLVDGAYVSPRSLAVSRKFCWFPLVAVELIRSCFCAFLPFQRPSVRM
jgi:hypothetical protein